MAPDRLDDRKSAPARSRCPKKGDAPTEAAAREGLSRSRGGLTAKLHAATDALGNPLRWRLTPGHRNDITQAADLIADVVTTAVVADRGYHADWLVRAIEASGAVEVIPSRSNKTAQRAYDASLYADRNKVERLFGRLKHYRRVATRYEKLGRNYLAMVYVASIMTLLR